MAEAENSRENEIKVKLDTTRNLLHQLGNGVSQLVNSSSDIFSDKAIQAHINEFQQVYEEAVHRLENPTFRIATIGTTSSGKSTIVNALIGRRIAPIESGEMSAGVLTLRHSEEHQLTIEKTKDAVWDTGKWKELRDQDVYERIKSAMYTYHEVRKNETILLLKLLLMYLCYLPVIQVY